MQRLWKYDGAYYATVSGNQRLSNLWKSTVKGYRYYVDLALKNSGCNSWIVEHNWKQEMTGIDRSAQLKECSPKT